MANCELSGAELADDAIGDATIGSLSKEEWDSVRPFMRAVELQEEYYRKRPLMRMLRALGLVGGPGSRARKWAERMGDDRNDRL